MTDIDFDAFYSVEGMPGIAWRLRGYVENEREVCEREPTCFGHPADEFSPMGETVYCEANSDGEFPCEGEEWIYELVPELDTSMVRAVMVGDDREHEIDVDELTVISEDDFCAGCGQIGCGH